MNRKMRKGLYLLVLLFLTTLCLPGRAQAKAAFTKEKVVIYEGQKKTLKVEGLSGKISFSSSDAKVAKVSKKGKVTGVLSGMATVTASNGKESVTCEIEVREVHMHRATRKAQVGEEFKLKLKCGATSGIVFSFSKEGIVSLSRQEGNLGYFKALAPGKVTVKATYQGKTYKCKVTVKDKVQGQTPTPPPITTPIPVYVEEGDWEPDVEMPITM